MMSLSYSLGSREACCIEDSFADIQHVMSLGYHPQLCSSRSIEEVVQSTLSATDKSLMIHFDKTEAARWTCMIFIPLFHNIYFLSFHFKHEGMNHIVDNFKSSRIIGVTNMIVKRTSNVLVRSNKCLSKCKYRLWLTYEVQEL